MLLSKIYKNNMRAHGFNVVVMWDPGKLYKGRARISVFLLKINSFEIKNNT